MAIVCQPGSLVAAAKCFDCIPHNARRWVRAYILCQIALHGLKFTLDISGGSSNGNTILIWNGGTSGNFEIWRSINGAPYSLLATVPGSSRTFIDNGVLANGDEWDYKIRTVSGGNLGSFSTPAGVTNALQSNPAVDSAIVFPNVVVAYGFFGTVNGAAHVLSWSAPRLHHVVNLGTLTISGCPKLTSINLPNLFSCDDIEMGTNPLLTTLSMSSLHDISGSPAASLGDLGVSGSNALVSLAVPNLVSVAGFIDISSCPALQSLSFPKLQSIGMDWNLSSETVITSVSMPALTTQGFVAGSSFCGTASSPALTSLSIPNVIYPNIAAYTIDDSGCALNAASVNQVLRRCVVSGLTSAAISLQGGTNSPPTGQGVADKATLIAAGNTVTTN